LYHETSIQPTVVLHTVAPRMSVTLPSKALNMSSSHVYDDDVLSLLLTYVKTTIMTIISMGMTNKTHLTNGVMLIHLNKHNLALVSRV
jgi:hypothetical protein